MLIDMSIKGIGSVIMIVLAGAFIFGTILIMVAPGIAILKQMLFKSRDQEIGPADLRNPATLKVLAENTVLTPFGHKIRRMTFYAWVLMILCGLVLVINALVSEH